MGNWLDKTGLTQIKTILKNKFETKVDVHPSNTPAGKFLQTNENGYAVWGDAASPSAVAQATEDWLDANVSGGQTIAVDASLTVEGAAADAKAAGRVVDVSPTQPVASVNKLWIKEQEETEYEIPTMAEHDDLKNTIATIEKPLDFTLSENNGIKYEDGDILNSVNLKHTNYIDVSEYKYLHYSRTCTTSETVSSGVAFYSSDSVASYISGVPTKASQAQRGYEMCVIPVPAGAKYFRATYDSTVSDELFTIRGLHDLGDFDPDTVKENYIELKDTMETVNGVKFIELTWGYYINTSVSSVDITSLTAHDTFGYAVVDCAEGDKFVINGTGGSKPRLWAFISSTGSRLSVSGASATGENLTVTAPENAAKLVINSITEGLIFKGETGASKNEAVKKLQDFADETEQLVIQLDDNIQDWFVAGNYEITNNVVNRTSSTANCIIPAFFACGEFVVTCVNSCTIVDYIADKYRNVLETTGNINMTPGTERRFGAGYHYLKMKSVQPTAAKTAVKIRVEYNSELITRNADAVQCYMCARRILVEPSNSYGLNQKTTLFHISDTHSDRPRWNNLKEIADKLKPKAIINTGDIVQFTFNDDRGYMMNNLPNSPTLIAVGNHDAGQNRDIGNGGATNEMLYEAFIEPLCNKYGFEADDCYYYYDVDDVRIIVLNCYDFDAHEGNVFTDRVHMYYSQDQIDWLIETLQDSENKAIVVCAHEGDKYLKVTEGSGKFNQVQHQSALGENTKIWEGNPICDILEAFITGGSIQQTYTEGSSGIVLSVNTSFNFNGHFVCWLVGHRHGDYCGFLPGYSQYLMCVAAGGCNVNGYVNSGNFGSDLPRMERTKTEDCFNALTIDTENKILTVVRFGSNRNLYMTMRDYDVIHYDVGSNE